MTDLDTQRKYLATMEIPVWVRDEWSETEKRVRDEAQAAGVDSPLIHVFLPKRNADALRKGIAVHAGRG